MKDNHNSKKKKNQETGTKNVELTCNKVGLDLFEKSAIDFEMS